jgi:hypothetical protein
VDRIGDAESGLDVAAWTMEGQHLGVGEGNEGILQRDLVVLLDRTDKDQQIWVLIIGHERAKAVRVRSGR